MPTLYRLDNFGGFTVADTALDVSAYAEPSSRFAVLAAEYPTEIAGALLPHHRVDDRTDADNVAHVRNMARLEAGRANGSTHEDSRDGRDNDVRVDRAESRFYEDKKTDAARTLIPDFDPTKARSAAVYARIESDLFLRWEDRPPETTYTLSGIPRENLSGKFLDTLAERMHIAQNAEYERLGDPVNIAGANYDKPGRLDAYKEAMKPTSDEYERGQQGTASRLMYRLDGIAHIRSGPFAGPTARDDDSDHER